MPQVVRSRPRLRVRLSIERCFARWQGRDQGVQGLQKRERRTPYFDGVVKSVEDGKCLITWEDGDETSMTETAVQKILV